MRLLLVDNCSIYTRHLERQLAAHTVERVSIRDFRASMTKRAHATILTGSARYNVELNAEEYAEQAEAIRGGRPVFGICAGHQLICTQYGVKLVQNDPFVRGVHELSMERDDPVLAGIHRLTAYQSHRWSALNAPGLAVLARSGAGVEIVRVPDTLTYGTQFHPEVRDGQNTGYRVLENWLRIVSKA